MTRTDQAIETLAEAFCKLNGRPDHKATYVKSLQSLTALARTEQILQMQLDFERCTRVTLKARGQ